MMKSQGGNLPKGLDGWSLLVDDDLDEGGRPTGRRNRVYGYRHTVNGDDVVVLRQIVGRPLPGEFDDERVVISVATLKAFLDGTPG